MTSPRGLPAELRRKLQERMRELRLPPPPKPRRHCEPCGTSTTETRCPGCGRTTTEENT